MKHFKAVGLYGAIALSIFLASCGSADKNALPVPKDVAFVVHVNTKSLSSKLSWEEIKKSNWYNMADRPETGVMKDLLQNPDTAGIDTKEDLAFFVRKMGKGGYMAFTGRLKNAAAFEAFNKKAAGGSAAVVKDGEISSITIQERSLASWKGDKFIYVMEMPATPSMADFNMPQSDSLSMDDTTSNYRMLPTPVGDLKGYARNLFNMKGDSLLVSDDRYSSLLKQDGDLHIWTNAESAMGQDMPMGMMSMLKLDKYFKGAVGATTLSFENGKISMHSKGYYNKEMTDLMKKYEGSDLNSNFIERVPSDNVVAVMAMNYKPEGLKEFLKLGGLDGLVNGFFGEIGITLDDFIKANKGDLVLALTDFQMKEYTVDLGEGSEPFKGTKPDINMMFVTSIGDKASFNKLLEVGKKFGGQMRTDTSIFYNMNNDLFVIGSNKQSVDQYVAGGKKSFPFLSKINGHPIGVYVDLQKVISAYSTRPADSALAATTAASLAMWQDIVMTGGEFKDGGMVQDAEVNLVDKNTNSLKQLNQYADKLAMANKRGF